MDKNGGLQSEFSGMRFCAKGALPLLHFLAAEMLDLNNKELGGFSGDPDLLVGQLLAGVVFHRKTLQQCSGLYIVLHQMASAEHNGALQIRAQTSSRTASFPYTVKHTLSQARRASTLCPARAP